MKFIISYVDKASVKINEKINKIGKGLLIYIGIGKNDTKIDLDKIAEKIINLKVIQDNNKINLSVKDINGEILLISNFTLYGKNKKGNKIDFLDSLSFNESKIIYDNFIKILSKKINLKTGEFGEHMEIESKNNGPLNYILEF